MPALSGGFFFALMRLATVFGSLLRIRRLFSGHSPGCFSFEFLLLAITHSLGRSNKAERD
jgi:hypothetical protein